MDEDAAGPLDDPTQPTDYCPPVIAGCVQNAALGRPVRISLDAACLGAGRARPLTRSTIEVQRQWRDAAKPPPAILAEAFGTAFVGTDLR